MDTPNTDDAQPDESRNEISRRETLKRLGIATAAAWSAPTILSTTAALAGTEGTEMPTTCTGEDFTCGGAITNCNGSDSCICDIDTEGNVRCWQDQSCANLRACSSSDDCDPGSYCYRDTCCGEPVCIPDCGPDSAPAAIRGANERWAGSRG